jgi:tetratricopeptide (TPR) repeat protein
MDKRFLIAKIVPYLLLSLWLFSPILNFDFLSYDDARFIHDNVLIYEGDFFQFCRWAVTNHLEAYWVPGAWFLHVIAVKMFGFWAGGHHLLSVMGHLLNAFLVCSIVEKLTGKEKTALIVGAFFLVHPVHVETVYWCTAIRDIYAALFALIAVRLHLENSKTLKKKSVYNVFELLFFLFACMCKPYIVMLPLVFFFLKDSLSVYDFDKLKGFGYLVIIAFIIFMNLWSRATYQNEMGQHADMITVGRYFDALQVPFLLFQKFVFPVELSLIYPRGRSYSLMTLLCGLGFIFWTSVVTWCQRIKRPMLWFGWLWYLSFLIIPVYMVSAILMADRYLYLPSIGLFLMASVFIEMILEKMNFKKTILVYIFLGVLFMLLVNAQRHYAFFWKNSKTLFEYMVKINPDNAVALNQLGIEYFNEGNYSEALKYFKAAVTIPQGKDVRAFNMNHLKNLSAGLATMGRLKQALQILELIYSEESQEVYQLNELGIIYDLKGDHRAAERVFKKVLVVDSLNEVALIKLAAIYIRECDVERGMITIDKLIGLNGKFIKQSMLLKELLLKIESSATEERNNICNSSGENNIAVEGI